MDARPSNPDKDTPVMPEILVIIQTDNPDAAAAVTATADEWNCRSVVIQDGRVTRPVASESEKPK